MSQPRLHPCPYCGSADVGLLCVASEGTFVRCRACLARGPAIKLPWEEAQKPAVTAWNARHAGADQAVRLKALEDAKALGYADGTAGSAARLREVSVELELVRSSRDALETRIAIATGERDEARKKLATGVHPGGRQVFLALLAWDQMVVDASLAPTAGGTDEWRRARFRARLEDAIAKDGIDDAIRTAILEERGAIVMWLGAEAFERRFTPERAKEWREARAGVEAGEHRTHAGYQDPIGASARAMQDARLVVAAAVAQRRAIAARLRVELDQCLARAGESVLGAVPELIRLTDEERKVVVGLAEGVAMTTPTTGLTDASTPAEHLAAVLHEHAERPEVDPLHPTGRCRCHGEGTCAWCVEHPMADHDALRFDSLDLVRTEGTIVDTDLRSSERDGVVRHTVRWPGGLVGVYDVRNGTRSTPDLGPFRLENERVQAQVTVCTASGWLHADRVLEALRAVPILKVRDLVYDPSECDRTLGFMLTNVSIEPRSVP